MVKAAPHHVLLDLQPAQLEELISMLFRKLNSRIGEVQRDPNRFFLDLLIHEERRFSHTLACCFLKQDDLQPELISNLSKEIPSHWGEIRFENVILLTPHEFPEAFQEEARRFEIKLIDGEALYALLVTQGLTFNFPTPTESLEKNLESKPSYLVLGIIAFLLILLYPVFTHNFFRQETKPLPVQSPIPVSSKTAPLQLSPSTPSPPKEPKRIEKKLSSHVPNKVEPPKKEAKRVTTNQPVTHQVVFKQVVPHPALKSKNKSVPTKINSQDSKHVAQRVVRHYSNIYDLQEKYYLIARDLEQRHFKAKARKYYQSYLRMAPDGSHASESREALQRLR